MSTKKIGIFGCSGFAREVADIARALGYTPVFVAKDASEKESFIFPEEIIIESDIGSSNHIGFFAIGVGENSIRKKIATRYIDKLNFINLIHPSASFGFNQKEQLKNNKGIVICAGVRFTNNINIGDFSIFNLNSTVGHDAIIGNYVNIAPGVCVSGNVHLQEGCWVGTGAVINQGLMDKKLIIGEYTTIGSGSVVVKDCDTNAVYVGIPARKIK